MKLFLELGNSRLKGALFDKRYEYLGAIDNSSIQKEDFETGWDIEDCTFENVYVCSVASHDFTSSLIERIQVIWGVYPVMITTQPNTCGVSCGYERFETLGVDRWMAIVAAACHSKKPLFIVSAGTALTVDVVVEKKHLGGFIVPGMSMMVDCLLNKTGRIKQSVWQFQTDSQNPDGLLARDTENAIQGGVLFMVSSYLNQLLAEIEGETGRKFECVATGGGFERLQPLLDKSFDYIEDLSLKGMWELIENC